ncbi:uncharacterized protein [Littorina saxatilis]|uniref:uncharacterized protein n=1 Tax=Littorina saxatilis TaxID=31220 RepID=UPI0038B68D20
MPISCDDERTSDDEPVPGSSDYERETDDEQVPDSSDNLRKPDDEPVPDSSDYERNRVDKPVPYSTKNEGKPDDEQVSDSSDDEWNPSDEHVPESSDDEWNPGDGTCYMKYYIARVSPDSDSRHRDLFIYAVCQCGHCCHMPTSVECVCCHDVRQIKQKLEGLDDQVGCITAHPGFRTICLDVYCLETAYYAYKQDYGRLNFDLHEL